MEQASPTRTEMLTRQAQIRLAEQGAELLRSKRDALVREFLAELKRFVEARKTMRRSVMEAVQALMQTLAVDGQEAVASAGLVSRRPVTVEVTSENIWGTKVFNMDSDYSVRSAAQRGYGSSATSARRVVISVLLAGPPARKGRACEGSHTSSRTISTALSCNNVRR